MNFEQLENLYNTYMDECHAYVERSLSIPMASARRYPIPYSCIAGMSARHIQFMHGCYAAKSTIPTINREGGSRQSRTSTLRATFP